MSNKKQKKEKEDQVCHDFEFALERGEPVFARICCPESKYMGIFNSLMEALRTSSLFYNYDNKKHLTISVHGLELDCVDFNKVVGFNLDRHS